MLSESVGKGRSATTGLVTYVCVHTRVQASVRACVRVCVSVCVLTPSTGLRHPSLEEGAGKQCSECVCVTGHG